MALDVQQTCGCKGVRTCLICERLHEKTKPASRQPKNVHRFVYDPETRLASSEDGEESASFLFPGVFLWHDFITEEEESELINLMDQDAWNPSQSGRRKQDFGPKVNFKKRKVRLSNFSGLPPWSQELVARMRREPSLASFEPVEQCNLDYHPERGSAIEPHLDDSWLWGERLVTLNMLSDTTLTMSEEEVRVAVGLPRRSLVVLQGEARHRWKHAIHREDVGRRRVCSTFRELSAEFLPGGERAEMGARLLDIALGFSGTPV
ncbi:unnamed protein product [Ophioblennius macclurei]